MKCSEIQCRKDADIGLRVESLGPKTPPENDFVEGVARFFCRPHGDERVYKCEEGSVSFRAWGIKVRRA